VPRVTWSHVAPVGGHTVEQERAGDRRATARLGQGPNAVAQSAGASMARGWRPWRPRLRPGGAPKSLLGAVPHAAAGH
jgi:hypothetical protein